RPNLSRGLGRTSGESLRGRIRGRHEARAPSPLATQEVRPSMAPPSLPNPQPKRQTLTARVRALEADVVQLKQRLSEPPPGDGWERMNRYCARKNVSRSTVERDVRCERLEVKHEGRRTYVREKQGAPAKRRRGRPPQAKGDGMVPVSV